ncbi:MAG TPA: hypothetical protein VNB24_04440, partial [Acidimicrobiales bacterium]|nr:hypothetical protein [Acidimicrobiales bacterium]
LVASCGPAWVLTLSSQVTHGVGTRLADPAVVTRQRIATGLLVLALAGACGDRTVTSPPAPQADDSTASTPRSSFPPDVAGSDPGPPAASAAEASLDDADRILDEVQQDLNTADREAATSEGDPTS